MLASFADPYNICCLQPLPVQLGKKKSWHIKIVS
jgi:hypothetical protein